MRTALQHLSDGKATVEELRDAATVADELGWTEIAEKLRDAALRIEFEKAREEAATIPPPAPTPAPTPTPPAVTETPTPTPTPAPAPTPEPTPEPTPAPAPAEPEPEPAEEAAEETVEPLVKSPWSDVSDEKWRAFVVAMAPGKTGTVTSGYHWGQFLHGARRLEDLGLIKKGSIVKKKMPAIGSYDGKSAVYTGEWVETPPDWTNLTGALSLERFLKLPILQYRTFVRDMQNHRAGTTRYKEYLGKTFEGKKLTLSGLLALAKQAGLKGAGDWLKGGYRAKNTTDAFLKTTGLF